MANTGGGGHQCWWILTPAHSMQVSNTSGQSYKQFTIVIYDSRVVIWGNFKSGTTLEL